MVKKVFLVLILTILLISTTNIVQASGFIEGAQGFIKNGEAKEPIDLGNYKETSDSVYNILLILGTVAAVIVGAILGLQFMVGSVEQKGKIKEALLPYFVGCVVIFGAFGIWKLVITILR